MSTVDRKEKQATYQKIIFFDADKTLWRVESKSAGDDYASKGAFEGLDRTFVLDKVGCVKRTEDETIFVLKEDVVETLEKLSREGIQMGIVSDNIYDDVKKVGELLNIWKFFDSKLINIRLWRGPADKALMIHEIMASFEEGKPSSTLLVDDSERYAEQMKKAGYSFVLSPKDVFPKDTILSFFGI